MADFHPRGFTHEIADRSARRATVALAGELDLSVTEELRALLLGLVHEGAFDLVLDFEGVRFLDSRTIGALIAVMKQANERGGSLVIRKPQPQVLKSLMILGLGPSFGLEPD